MLHNPQPNRLRVQTVQRYCSVFAQLLCYHPLSPGIDPSQGHAGLLHIIAVHSSSVCLIFCRITYISFATATCKPAQAWWMNRHDVECAARQHRQIDNHLPTAVWTEVSRVTEVVRQQEQAEAEGDGADHPRHRTANAPARHMARRFSRCQMLVDWNRS